VKPKEPKPASESDVLAERTPAQRTESAPRAASKPRKRGALPAPFRYRGRWRIQVTMVGGKRQTRDFDKHAEALQWAREILLQPNEPKQAIQHNLANSAHADQGELGGPTKATLADALFAYAHLCTVSKRGALAEVCRINRYLSAVGRPLLRLSLNDGGKPILETVQPRTQKTSLAVRTHARRQQRKETYAHFARLGALLCADIKTSDIRKFKVCMEAEGLSDSTIQKEIAMLKVVFRTAQTEWDWADFRNPCATIKLGKSNPRFVHLDKDEEVALSRAIDECDNPYIAPLVFIARETTLRRGTLLNISWSDVDLKNRCMLLNTKSGKRRYVFSVAVQEVLQQLKDARDSFGSEKVFPLTDNALGCAWKRLCARAGLQNLHFKDLRHLGATTWVRRGLGAHQLKAVLGHSTIATAQFYVDLVGEDELQAIDSAMEKVAVLSLPHVAEDAQKSRNLQRAARLNKRHQQPADDLDPSEEDERPVDKAGISIVPKAAPESKQAEQISPIAVLPSTSGLVNFALGNAFPTTYQYSLKSLPSQPRH
jgi:integrase